MKKFIQFSLVIILVFALFQAVSAGSGITSASDGSGAAGLSSGTGISAEGVEMTANCLVRIKGVICVRPNVGWNS